MLLCNICVSNNFAKIRHLDGIRRFLKPRLRNFAKIRHLDGIRRFLKPRLRNFAKKLIFVDNKKSFTHIYTSYKDYIIVIAII